MAERITYPGKTNNPADPDSINVWHATEANEVKAVVNAHADDIEALASGFQGGLSVSDTPTEDGYYFAEESGTYTNAGGIVVDLNDGITIIIKKGVNFSAVVIPLTSDIVRQNTFIEAMTKAGVVASFSDLNIVSEYTDSDLDDLALWGVGFLRTNGTIADAETGWRHTVKYIPISYISTYSDVTLNFSGNSALVFYNINKEIVGFLESVNENYTDPISPPSGAVYFRFSHRYITSTGILKVITSETKIEATDTRFIGTSFLTSMGVFSSNENYLRRYSTSDIDDLDLWGIGFLHATDGDITFGTWHYTRDYIPVPASEVIELNLRIEGNAALIYYDENKMFISSLSSPSGSTLSGQFTTPVNAAYIRFSHGNAYPVGDIRMTSTAPFYYAGGDTLITSDTFGKSLSVILDNFNLIYRKAGFNFLLELSENSLLDTDIWIPDSYLSSLGSVVTGPGSIGWYVSKKFYRVGPGTFNLVNRFSGNAKCVAYSAAQNVVQAYTNDAGGDFFDGEIIFPPDAEYFRVSYRGDDANQRLQINLKSSVDTYFKDTQSETQLGIRDVYRKTYQPIEHNPPIISFISDDGHILNDWYLNMLDVHGYKSSFAIISGRMDVNPDFYTKEQVRQLMLDGHDVAGHTVTHDGLNRLTTLTEDQLDYEIGYNMLTLKGIDGRLKPRMFVSPFGARNSLVDKVCRKFYNANFISRGGALIPTGECTNIGPIDTFNIIRVGFDIGGTEWEGVSNIDLMKQAVDVAVANGGWLVFAVHPHFPEYNNPNTVDRRDELNQLFLYIKSLDVPVMTASQAFDVYKNRVEIGYKTIDPLYYSLGSNGLEDGNYFD